MDVQPPRRHDELVEKNMQKILNTIYKNNGIKYARVDDPKLQKRGIDLYLYDSGRKIPTDEKSASTFFTTRLKTFVFELSAKSNYNNSGWFDPKNKNILTEDYILAYPYAPNRDKMDMLETVDEIEVLFLKKSVVWNYLSNNGIKGLETAQKLIEKKGIPQNKYGYPINEGETPYKISCKINDNIRLVYSVHLREKPLNILISRDKLRELAYKVISD